MRFVSLRSAVLACLSLAVVLSLGISGVANAKKVTYPEGEVLAQCSGASEVKGEGSTFQGPLQFIWGGFNTEKEEALDNRLQPPLGCRSLQRSEANRLVRYKQKKADTRGSGSCLKTIGIGIKKFEEEIGGIKYPRVNTYPFCGTDEAPTAANKVETEAFAEEALEPGETEKAQTGEGIETIPIAQGAAGNHRAPAERLPRNERNQNRERQSHRKPAVSRSTTQPLRASTAARSKHGKKHIVAQGTDGKDSLSCTGGEAEENQTIRPVVRQDKSGTTHIFKAWLLQVYGGEFGAEAFEKVNGTEEPCKGKAGLEAGHSVTW